MRTLQKFAFCICGTKNFTFMQGSYKRLEESAGLEFDIYSLLTIKSAFWHHVIHEINNTRCETMHGEDRLLGAGPPSNRLCIMKLDKLFYNKVIV